MPEERETYSLTTTLLPRETLLPGDELTLKSLSDTCVCLSDVGVPDDAIIDIKKESPNRPGETPLVHITVTWYR